MRKKKHTDYNHAEIIKTQRLILLPVSHVDVEDIYSSFTSDVTIYMMPAPAKDMKAQIKVINGFIKNMERGKTCMYSIKTDDGEFLGLVGIHNLDTLAPKFGIWLKNTAHSHGFGREAVQGVYDTYCKLYSKFTYRVDERNISSRKIAESLGGVVKGEMQILKGMGGNELHILTYEIDGKAEE